jgi:hypothetical protein
MLRIELSEVSHVKRYTFIIRSTDRCQGVGPMASISVGYVDFGISASSECRFAVLPVEAIGLDVIQMPDRSLELCGINSQTLNGLLSAPSFKTSRVAFRVLTTGAS